MVSENKMNWPRAYASFLSEFRRWDLRVHWKYNLFAFWHSLTLGK